jgi:transposase
MIVPQKTVKCFLISGAIMKKEYINEAAWSKILTFLRSVKRIHAKNEKRLKRFIEAVWWMARSGAQWRLLDSSFADWNGVFKRFKAWSKKGMWGSLLQFCIEDPDLEYIMIDATIVRAHACCAGYGDQAKAGLGRSKGGFTSKIHAKVDALGNPLQFIITPGQRNEITQAMALVGDNCDCAVLGDKGYDAKKFREFLRSKKCSDVIPSQANAKYPHPYDEHLYKERHAIECLFSKIKQFRRIFSRFDKSSRNFTAFLNFVGALIWLR